MLLCMSGGLPTDDPWADRQESITSAELRTILEAGTPLSSMPGTAYEYSNLGYALLGQVIESVTGRSYVEVITAQLLEPLGLSSTTFDALAVDDDRRAVGYRRAGGAWLELPFSSPGAFSPIGGACTSARDLIRWSTWLSSAFSPTSGPSTPLSASSRREMQQIQRTIPVPAPATTQDSEDVGDRPRIVANGYGFGLFLRDDDRHGLTASHPGGYPGFSSNMRWNPRTGIGVVAFENTTYAGVGTAAAPALSMVLDGVGHTQPPTPWQRTRECMAVADRLIDAWDDRLAAQYLAENVALDSPFAERSEAIAAARDAVGGLVDGTGSASAALVPDGVSGTSPAHIVWYRAGCNGRLRCELRLAPVNPPLIQTFTVAAEVTAEGAAEATGEVAADIAADTSR
jgi:CubicO group peptidase (beta-lactamase class C family)